MTALIQQLRVDVHQLQREGVKIALTSAQHKPFPRGHNMPNVTAAVRAYQASDKAWGRLSEIATQYNTTPGSILGRIRRKKL